MRALSRDPHPSARQAQQAYLDMLEAEARELDEYFRWEEEDFDPIVMCPKGHVIDVDWEIPLVQQGIMVISRDYISNTITVSDYDCPICHPPVRIGNMGHALARSVGIQLNT